MVSPNDQEPVRDEGVVLPSCVREVDAAATELYEFVASLPFPNLSVGVSTPEEAAPIVHEALQWAAGVNHMHRAVVRMFPPRETGVEVPVPPLRLEKLRLFRLPDGRVSSTYTDTKPARGKVTRRSPRITIASDVLEPIPERFRDSLASAFPCAGWYVPGDPVGRHLLECLRSTWDRPRRWPRLAHDLHEAMIVVRFKCLGLVAWIRERVDELRRATWPEITWESQRPYGGQVVRVSMAGASRLEDLTKSEYELLLGLATGRASASRTTKSDLMKKIHEFNPLVKSLGPASHKTWYYSVPECIRSRIDVARNS